MNSQYDTIIFDLDGTLLNTLEDLTDACNYVLEKYHYSKRTIEEIRSFVGNGIRRLLELAIPGGLENPAFEEMYESFSVYYMEHCMDKTKPYPQIQELLTELKKQEYKMAIVSNKSDAAVKELRGIFFAKAITISIGESKGVRKKPAPDTALQALKELGAAKENALYVGDSEVDYQTAQNAGMDCVLVSWGFRNREMLESLRPVAVIDEPMQLLHYL